MKDTVSQSDWSLNHSKDVTSPRYLWGIGASPEWPPSAHYLHDFCTVSSANAMCDPSAKVHEEPNSAPAALKDDSEARGGQIRTGWGAAVDNLYATRGLFVQSSTWTKQMRKAQAVQKNTPGTGLQQDAPGWLVGRKNWVLLQTPCTPLQLS